MKTLSWAGGDQAMPWENDAAFGEESGKYFWWAEVLCWLNIDHGPSAVQFLKPQPPNTQEMVLQ